MLIDFEVGNFLSFDEAVQFSMLASSAHKTELPPNVFVAGPHDLLKAAVIYGANASGKSNLLNAMAWMRQLILNSHTLRPDEAIDVRPFKLRKDALKESSHFQCIFFLHGETYRYGFDVMADRVDREWLFRIKPGSDADKALFLREDEQFTINEGFSEGKDLDSKTKRNTLFLSVVSQFNGPLAGTIVKWFEQLAPVRGLVYKEYESESLSLLNEDSESFIEFIRQADLGIDRLHMIQTDTAPEAVKYYIEANPYGGLVSRHKASEDKAAFFVFESEESEGTKKFVRLAGPILNSLRTGRVVIIDEIDASLHPLLVKALVQLFVSEKTNPHNAQLIFNTHDTNLLCCGIFRRDQIWFTEKTRQGATDLYSLVEIKLDDGTKVRKDASYEKQYIQGRYGAIPFLGDFANLLGAGD